MRAVPWDISICGGEVGFFLHGLGERVLSEKRSRCASLAGRSSDVWEPSRVTYVLKVTADNMQPGTKVCSP